MVYRIDSSDIFSDITSIYESFINTPYDLSPEDINSICESVKDNSNSVLESFVDAGYDYDFFTEAANKLDVDLKKSDIAKYKAKIQVTGKVIANTLKKEGLNSESRKKIRNIVSDLFENIAKDIVAQSGEEKSSKAFAGIMLVISNIVISTLINSILAILVGPGISMAITAAIVAPIVEEASKIISIKGGFDKEYYIAFNTFEFTSYVSSYGPLVGFGKMIRARLMAVGMHSINTIIHEVLNSEKFRKALKMEDEKDLNDKRTLISYIIGLVIHCGWNIMGLNPNSSLNKFAMGD